MRTLIRKVFIGKKADGSKGRDIIPILALELPAEYDSLASGGQSPDYEKTLTRYRASVPADD